MCSFRNRSFTSGILNKSTVSAKFTCMWRKHELLRESNSRMWLIVWFPEIVDWQISGMSWRLCHKNIVYKHKNALGVFSWSNFVLDNRLWGQKSWILEPHLHVLKNQPRLVYPCRDYFPEVVSAPLKFWALVPHFIWDQYVYSSKIGSALP